MARSIIESYLGTQPPFESSLTVGGNLDDVWRGGVLLNCPSFCVEVCYYILFFEMGQTSFNCQAKPTTPRDLFSQQLSIYQWRANPNNNNFVARVSFKNAYTQKQEQKFAEFLRQQEQENYLEIYKFKEEVQDFRKLSAEEVIVFEKYACSLNDLHGRLRLEDVLYALHGLLLGFEELRKIYQRIVVEDCCCFVTNEGQVRAWINPNPKSNQVWAGLQDQLTLEVNIRTILNKIVSIAQRTAFRTLKSEEFFRIAYSLLAKSAFKHCYYADLRRVINEFCYLNNIQMSKNLLQVLKLRESQNQFRKSYKREQRNTESSQPCLREREREKVTYLPTAESESNLQNKSLLLKSKSLENHLNEASGMTKQSYMRQQPTNFSGMPHVLATVSQIVQNRGEECRLSTSQMIKQRNSHMQETRGSGINNKASTLICSQDFKKSALVNQQILEVESAKSSNSRQPISSAKQSAAQIKQQAVPTVQVINPNECKRPSKTDKTRKGRQTINKNMLVSIVQNLPDQNNENKPPSLVKQQHHHKTCMERYSVEESSQGEVYWSRPWITTKTITKLISQHDSSLKNSIAQSSDYYNDSVYSGALTHLGRDIAPPNADRSKTVRISRDR